MIFDRAERVAQRAADLAAQRASRAATMDLLVGEYKILQDKIDKIGAFRFTIKGWAVTATLGGLAAIATGKGFSPRTTSLAIDLLLCWFFIFERDQVQLGWLFNARARRIEIEVDKLRRRMRDDDNSLRSWQLIFSTPNIARAIFGHRRRRELFRAGSRHPQVEHLRVYINQQWRLAHSSEVVFYLVLGASAWIPSLFTVVKESKAITSSPKFTLTLANGYNHPLSRSIAGSNDRRAF